MLEEEVYLLEYIEGRAKAMEEKKKEEQLLHDYVRKLDEFVEETEEIEGRLGNYKAMKFD
jgi:hypothetical protein